MSKEEKTSILVYTDGSCIKGDGGWCFMFVKEENNNFIVHGNERDTTNNRMELRAVIEALNFGMYKKYKIVTDSLYVINGAIGKNKRNLNLDLWEKYDKISKNKEIEYEWVKGHSGDKYNEIVDNFAFREAKGMK